MSGADEVRNYFQELGMLPCKEAGLPGGEVYMCPKAAWGGCFGRWGECDPEFIEMSKRARDMGMEGESFRERFRWLYER